MIFHEHIVALAKENTLFRKELATNEHSQVVLMSIPPGGDIGEEVHHDVDQILVFVDGEGEAVLDDASSPVSEGHLVVVPAGTKHNFITKGDRDMKLYTIYAPPEHAPGTVHATKADAEAAEGAHHV